MKVMVTGSSGFLGRNLCGRLGNIRDGKIRNEEVEPLLPLELLRVTRSTPSDEFDRFCNEADFVFHLAGKNRSSDDEDFQVGNVGSIEQLVLGLERHGNKCPVVLSSSIQVELNDSVYSGTKRAAEELLLGHAAETGSKAYVFRLPNLFGKWGKPNYNSVVATFCYNIANGLPITINDPDARIELLYVDDVVDVLVDTMLGKVKPGPSGLCDCGMTYSVTVGEIASALERMQDANAALEIIEDDRGSFVKKLYATFLSYRDAYNGDQPNEDWHYELVTNCDDRGSFTELFRTEHCGQVSINVSKPGIVKGQHWHDTKWEKFCVVSGHGKICQRKVGLDESGNPYPILERNVSGDRLEVVETIPGYTHNLINTSETEDMVTIIWCNECFDPQRPDTYAEPV